jgi:hypothetical protein
VGSRRAFNFSVADALNSKERKLHITGDSLTKGVDSVFSASDISSGHSTSAIIRDRGRHEWQLSSTELYALLALADEQRNIWSFTDVYKVYYITKFGPFSNSNIAKVHVFVIHTHWIQRLSANISSGYLASIISGNVEILGHVDIHRTPWFDFTEESGRQGILQAIFEYFPLSTVSTVPHLPPFPTLKRKFTHDLGTAEEKRQKNTACAP